MMDKVEAFTFKLESNFYLTVIRHGLAMMIPFILTGGIAIALANFPLQAYQDFIRQTAFYNFLNIVNLGTFGIFSVAMLISLSASYCMENNMSMDRTILYVLVSLGSFGALLYSPETTFSTDMFGVKGCFFAITTAILSCRLLDYFRYTYDISLSKHTFGMERITAISIGMLIPALIVIGIFAMTTHLILFIFKAKSLYGLISDTVCLLFRNINSEFLKGLAYTTLLHILWAFGLHGSDILEPVAQSQLGIGVSGKVLSKTFFDINVVMGGCGTTLCVLLVILVFFRKSRLSNLAKLSSFTVIFNMNEMLTFGIPIILNPVLIVPFLLTPIACYIVAFFATSMGLVPIVTHEVIWSTPVLFSGYIATGSISGSILQIILLLMGMGIYAPFIKMNFSTQEKLAKDQLQNVIKLLMDKESLNEPINLYTMADRNGQISRVLREDLIRAIKRNELFMLYQPQVDKDGKCIGAEALLRWNHPLYGSIYPPLIIYLAKEGHLLEDLERKIIQIVICDIDKVKKEYGEDFKISINLTAKSLLWDIEKYIDAKLKEHDINPQHLWIEITEQDVLTNQAVVINKLETLRDRGHMLMIDDFGMGHTSIMYLQSSQFGVVKLDGTLVKDICENSTKQEIISSIVSLSKNLHIKVISEYVETEIQRDKLLELGCLWYQGYLYSKPITIDEFITFIKEQSN